MMITPEYRKKQYRIIYEILFETPRVSKRDISPILKTTRKTVRKRMKEAFEQQYIVGPEIRKKSFQNLKEYVYLVNCENPDFSYLNYREDTNVIYHAQMSGFCNLFVIAKKEIDIDADIIIEGPRSDYYMPFTPNHSWEKAIQIMRKKVSNFNSEEYEPQKIIKTHWSETIKWDLKDEILYSEMKYNMRKPLDPLTKKYHISREKIENWVKKLPVCCTVATSYYPETLPEYDPYLFMFETDYEDFIIDVFSELPTSTSFFKVSDYLFLLAHVSKPYIRSTDLAVTDSTLYIPPIMVSLLEKAIVTRKVHAIFEYSKGKNL